MTPQERIARARQFRAEVIAARDSFRDQLAAKTAELDVEKRIADRWKALAEMTLWAELDSGANIAVGQQVRYLLHTYECTTAHTKSLTRRPTNASYWKLVE